LQKKSGLTLKQHELLGEELLLMRDRIGELTVIISKAYPVKMSDPLLKAQAIIDRLRAQLDSKAAKENKGNKRDYIRALNIYYRAKTF